MQPPAVRTEDLIPIKSLQTAYGDIHFYCAGRVCLYRADTFFIKEPETLAWIDAFSPKDVLWDIGANVGTYSVYAARKGCQVMSFEPSAFNYFVLLKNIHINALDERISAFCMALDKTSRLNSFKMSFMEVGDSCHTLGDFNGAKDMTAGLRQAVLTLSIDDFIFNFNPPFPTHIKIDVDGVEEGIIHGATKTLRNPRLKSVLIELDENQEFAKVAPQLEAAGFRCIAKERAPMYADSSLNNCIFIR